MPPRHTSAHAHASLARCVRYFALSLYFLYNSKMLVRRRNEAFRYIQYFNYAVIMMQLIYQVSSVTRGPMLACAR